MAGGTKRMSMEEKRKAVLDIYHKSKSVYTEKEILALAAKAGVNANTIADVNQSLVDDGLVDKEKISGANYFWSFPAKKDHMAQVEHRQTLAEIEKLKVQAEQAACRLADAKRGREDTVASSGGGGGGEEEAEESNSRPKKLARLAEMAREKAALETELASLKENDPAALADLQKELKLVSQAANRWTDNIFQCKTYLIKKRGMDKKEVNRILGITDNFDYPEDKIPK